MSGSKTFNIFIAIMLAAAVLTGCEAGLGNSGNRSQNTADKSAAGEVMTAAQETESETAEIKKEPEKENTTVRLIVTSDMHGMMLPWDYVINEEYPDGSLAQVASVIKEKRNDNTIVIDAGDIIQDNSAEMFLDEPVHPMVLGMNAIGYDIFTTGNHEYNYGMDIVKNVIASQKAKVILSNVYDKDGKRLADPYTIVERGGVKIGFIGAVSPNIVNWDKDTMVGYKVTNPVDELNAAAAEIKDKADIIVAVVHMDMNNELGTPGSGVKDIQKNCPGIDFICAGHGHNEIAGGDPGSIPVVENKFHGQTVMVSDLNLVRENGKWKVGGTNIESVHTDKYAPDPEIAELLKAYDQRAKEYAETEVGQLELGDISDKCDIPGVPNKFTEDSTVLDFGSFVMKYYSGADVVSRPPTRINEEIKQGPVRYCDIAKHYKYKNEIYVLKMNGKQLRKWMEFSACFFNQTKPGDLSISFNEGRAYYNYYVLTGVNYEINISKPEGERIENLTWSDGRPVKDDDEFTFATTEYDANAFLLNPGVIYEESEGLPELINTDIGKGTLLGTNDIRLLMIDYIHNVKNGVITPATDNNWKITGFNPDKEKRERAIELIKEGKLKIENSDLDRHINTKPITEEMLKEAEK